MASGRTSILLTCAMILIMAQGFDPTDSSAQNTINRNLDEALEMAYTQLHTALQGRPEAIRGLEQTQAAWLKYRDLDAAAIGAWPPRPDDDEAGETPEGWKRRLTEQRALRLREEFAGLPLEYRLKARPAWPATEREFRDDDFTSMTRAEAGAKLGLPPVSGYDAERESKQIVGFLAIDLNQDGEQEFIIKDYPRGSAPERYTIYQKAKAGAGNAGSATIPATPYTVIGWLYGNGLKLLARDHQYYQLEVSYPRYPPGGNYNLKLYRFQQVSPERNEDLPGPRILPRERYQVIRVDRYANGEYILTRPAISED